VMAWDDFRLEFDDDDTLHMRGFKDRREAICPICREPIRWVLDMASFTSGTDHVYAHARCVWTREAFLNQAELVAETCD
jgi:hypothetical protein